MNDCRRLLPLLDAFVDSELSADETLEVEQHLVGCRTCHARVALQRSLKLSVRRAVRESETATDAFRRRVVSALSAERERERARAQSGSRGRMLPWRSIVPLAAAAAIALLVGVRANQQHSTPAEGPQRDVTNTASMMDRLLDDFVMHHANPPLPEVVDEALVGRLEPEVGVPVRAPSLRQYGAEWEGGSTVWMDSPRRRVATLRYNLGGHHVTIFMYDAARIPLRASLEPRVVHNVPVYVGTRRGYSIAASEKRGMGYAVTSDLDGAESAELLAASF